jgi:hypothetical protein
VKRIDVNVDEIAGAQIQFTVKADFPAPRHERTDEWDAAQTPGKTKTKTKAVQPLRIVDGPDIHHGVGIPDSTKMETCSKNHS